MVFVHTAAFGDACCRSTLPIMAPTINKKTKLSSTQKLPGKRIRSTVLAALNDNPNLLDNLSSASGNSRVDADEISSEDRNDEAADNKATESGSDNEPMNILTPPATATKKHKCRLNKCE